MKRVARIIAIALPLIGLIVSFIFTSPSKPGHYSGTFISSSTHSTESLFVWMTTESAPSCPCEELEDDDDDSAKEHSKLTNSQLFSFLTDKHFFDHPSFDQTCIQVATPPPKA